jgi:uncharacterized membrane protein YhaH (DUF805 family)
MSIVNSDVSKIEMGSNRENFMFSSSLLFHGRIRRTEYNISLIVVSISNFVLYLIIESFEPFILVLLAYILNVWFSLAQGTKRCHDIGKSWWYQLIPIMQFWLIFKNSQDGTNEYGRNPKL